VGVDEAKIVGVDEAATMMSEDVNDANSKWWTEKSWDEESDRHERLMESLESYIQFVSQQTIAAVGHSNFFHELVCRCLCPVWAGRHPDLAARSPRGASYNTNALFRDEAYSVACPRVEYCYMLLSPLILRPIR
jgi:hypothetical protein